METNSKITTYKKYIKYFLIFLVIFTFGLLTERFDLDKRVLKIFKNSLDSISRISYSFTSKEKIFINIKPQEYEKIRKNREAALEKKQLTKEIQDWVPAKLKTKNTSHDIRMRLKGAFSDHWDDPTQWSFKVRVENDSKPVFDLRRFNLQPPKTISYLYEWLLMKAFEKEKLISLGAKYLDLIVNDSSRGAYILQGGISEEIIKKNKRPLGPIVGFSKDLFLEEQINSEKLKSLGAVDSLNGIEDTFWRAKIEPVQFSEDQIGGQQELYLNKAISLLESFRKQTLKPSKIFDINQLAKVMALRAVLGSSEFDWRDTKFYFNPETSLLEPISKEAHVRLDLNFKEHYFSWWIDSSHIRPHYTNSTNFFLDILYSDYDFYKTYLSYLNNFSKNKYYENLIKENYKEFKNYKKILEKNYPTKKIFSMQQLEINRIRIQDFLNPIQGLNAYFVEYKENVLYLNISNLQRLPVEILGILFDDNSKIYKNEPRLIKGKKPLLPLENIIVKIDCKFKEDCKKLLINKQKIIFKILGQEKEKKAEISQHYFKSK